MGRGWGGYIEKSDIGYKDSGGNKVIDKNAIFVAEQYIRMGYEAVFRRRLEPLHSYDLTIKTKDDMSYVKNIEVKGVVSLNPSKIATRINEAFEQLENAENGTVAIYLPKHKSDAEGRNFAEEGFKEAVRKRYVRGPVEVWFSDGEKIDMKSEDAYV